MLRVTDFGFNRTLKQVNGIIATVGLIIWCVEPIYLWVKLP